METMMTDIMRDELGAPKIVDRATFQAVATFPSDKQLCSWVAVCPGDNESGGVNYSHRSPKGNRQMRRILDQAANAAASTKGSIFEIVYRRQVTRMDIINPSE
jgi:transposase